MTISFSTADISSSIRFTNKNGFRMITSDRTTLREHDQDRIRNHIAKIETFARNKNATVIVFPSVLDPIFAGCLQYMGYTDQNRITIKDRNIEFDANTWLKQC